MDGMTSPRESGSETDIERMMMDQVASFEYALLFYEEMAQDHPRGGPELGTARRDVVRRYREAVAAVAAHRYREQDVGTCSPSHEGSLMPKECAVLDKMPSPLACCLKCFAFPFVPFMRGQVQRSRRSIFSWPPFKVRPYCAIICSECKEIVSWEAP